jgi:hypothetical protein
MNATAQAIVAQARLIGELRAFSRLARVDAVARSG